VLYDEFVGFQVQAIPVFLHCVLAELVVVSVVHESGQAVLALFSAGE
jgi:hypothetical protein